MKFTPFLRNSRWTAVRLHQAAWPTAFFLMLVIAAMPCRAADDATTNTEKLRKAWKSREEQFETLHFEFIVEEETRIDSLPSAVQIRQNFPDAEEYITSVTDRSLRLNGDKVDHRSTTRDGEKLHKPIGRRTAFDGQISQSFSGAPNPTVRGSGVVTNERYAFDVPGVHMLPILLTYRALHTKLGGGIDLEDFALSDEVVEVGDARCLVLREKADVPRHREYFVDPAQGFVVRQYTAAYRGGASVRIDKIEYSTDVKYGLVPARWNCLVRDRMGRLFETAQCTVKSYGINTPLADSEFEVEFPEGTLVHDRRTNREFFSRGAKAGVE